MGTDNEVHCRMTENPQTARVRRRRGGKPRQAPKLSADFTNLTAEETADLHEALQLAPLSRIDEIVSKYTGDNAPGAPIDMAAAFPDPPPTEPSALALSGAVRAPNAAAAYAPANPVDTEALAAENAYRKEHQLKLMHRMMMRSASVNAMATALSLTLAEVYSLRRELHARLAAEAGGINLLSHAASTMAFYDEIRGIAMRKVDTREQEGTQDGTQERTPREPAISNVDRARFMAVAMAAENNKHRFLQVAGFYKGATLAPKDIDQDASDDMAVLGAALRSMMEPGAYEEEMGDVIDGELSEHVGLDADDLIKVL